MSSPIQEGSWTSYFTSTAAAAVALPPIFRGYIAKSQLQLGQPLSPGTYSNAVKEGIKAAPALSAVVGLQMFVKKHVEPEEKTTSTLMSSSAVAGFVSSPFMAMVNGRSMGWSVKKSWERLSFKVAGAITAQEAFCVAGITAQKQIAPAVHKKFGKNKALDLITSFVCGCIGGAAGHTANVATTRWANDLKMDHPRQFFWGASRRIPAVGCFSVIYNLAEDFFNSLAK